MENLKFCALNPGEGGVPVLLPPRFGDAVEIEEVDRFFCNESGVVLRLSEAFDATPDKLPDMLDWTVGDTEFSSGPSSSILPSKMEGRGGESS